MNANHKPVLPDQSFPPPALAAVVDWLQAEHSGWDEPARLHALAERLTAATAAEHGFIARVHESLRPPPVLRMIAGAVRKPPGYRAEQGAELAIACFVDALPQLEAGDVLATGDRAGRRPGRPPPFGCALVPIRTGATLWGMIGLTDETRPAMLESASLAAVQAVADLLALRLRPDAAAAGEAARSTDAVLGAALDLVAEPFSVYNGDLRAVRHNKAWREMLAHVRPGEDLHGIGLIDIYRAHVEQGLWTLDHADEMFRDIASGRFDINRERIAHVAGRYKRTRAYAMPDGGFVTIHNDINELVERQRELAAAKEEAELASRAKSTFLANVSHELRTPLNAIIGFSDVMVRQIFGELANRRYREYAQDIHDSGNLLLSLINDILDMARIEAGKVELRPEPLPVDALLRDVLRMVELRAEAKGLSLRVHVPPGLPSVQVDQRATIQILLNLVGNAIKFTPPGGTVAVSVAAQGPEVLVQIADTGPGIDPALLARLGRPFEQADDLEIDVTRENKGTGLGLAISRALAERQGGRLTIASEPGQGTTVEFTLPAVPHAT